MANLPRGYSANVVRPPRPIAGIIIAIPLLLVQTLVTVLSLSVRRVLSSTDVPLGEDLFRSMLRMMINVSPFSVKRYMTSSPLNNDKTFAFPRFQTYRWGMCKEVSTTEFSGYWICRDLYSQMRTPKQPEHPSKTKTLIWIHGGAYVVGNPLSNIPQQIRIAEILATHGIQLDVFSLRYGLGPETKFPMQEEQAVAAYRYLLEVEKINPKDIIVHGESAGGHLALLMFLALSRPECDGLRRPGGAFLMYPWVNLLHTGESFRRNKNKCMLSRSSLEQSVDEVVGGAEGRKRWSDRLDFAAPRKENEASWKDILPDRSWIDVGSHDLFADDVQALCRNAESDGAAVVSEVTKGKMHGWQLIEDSETQSKYCALGSEEDVPKNFMTGSQKLAEGLLQVVKDV